MLCNAVEPNTAVVEVHGVSEYWETNPILISSPEIPFLRVSRFMQEFSKHSCLSWSVLLASLGSFSELLLHWTVPEWARSALSLAYKQMKQPGLLPPPRDHAAGYNPGLDSQLSLESPSPSKALCQGCWSRRPQPCSSPKALLSLEVLLCGCLLPAPSCPGNITLPARTQHC